MFESFGVWATLESWQIGLLFFPLGLIAASFGSVVRHRLPTGEPIGMARSRCTICGHNLRWYDLVPVFSFLWLRGRCRYCTLPISPTYPLMELGCGQLAAVCGLLGGWTAGTVALVAWVLGSYGLALVSRHRSILRDEAGVSLVEVLLATLLLTLVAGTVFQTITFARKSALSALRRTQAVALARHALGEASTQAMNHAGSTLTVVPTQVASPMVVEVNTWPYGSVSGAWWVEAKVSCPTCLGVTPKSGAEVTLVSVVRR